MILALDVYYSLGFGYTAGFAFEPDMLVPYKTYNSKCEVQSNYKATQFYKRELPCLMTLISEVDLRAIDSIIVDGYCFVNNDMKLGLGGHLYFYLEEQIPVIGVAKNKLENTDLASQALFRGKSKKPLYISSIGMDLSKAIELILNLKGDHRIPTILKNLDCNTKSIKSHFYQSDLEN